MYRILIQSIIILDQFLPSQNQVKNSFRYFYLEIPKLPPEEPGWLQSMELQQSQTQLRRGQWHPTPVLLPGKSHGQRSLVG